MTSLLTCVRKLEEWIVESEMGGNLDKSDPFYSAYKQLQVIKEKLEDEG